MRLSSGFCVGLKLFFWGDTCITRHSVEICVIFHYKSQVSGSFLVPALLVTGLGVMLDQDAEMFAKGLSELRMYVSQQRKRVVPWNYVSDSSFRLGGSIQKMSGPVVMGLGRAELPVPVLIGFSTHVLICCVCLRC